MYIKKPVLYRWGKTFPFYWGSRNGTTLPQMGKLANKRNPFPPLLLLPSSDSKCMMKSSKLRGIRLGLTIVNYPPPPLPLGLSNCKLNSRELSKVDKSQRISPFNHYLATLHMYIFLGLETWSFYWSVLWISCWKLEGNYKRGGGGWCLTACVCEV